MIPSREEVRAMLMQALAEARSRGAGRISALHLEMFDAAPETEQALRGLLAKVSAGTLAETAEVITFPAPSRFICWNCCGLRFQGTDSMCPNCGHEGMLIPIEVTFALEHIEIE